MKLSRFFRDAGVLLAFCGAFYLLTVFVGRLDGGTSDGTDFSVARKKADAFVEKRAWERAALEFKKLTKQDPYDGHAWFECGASYYRCWDEQKNQLSRQQAAGVSEEELADTQAKIDAFETEAKTYFSRAREFARYRAVSLFRCAEIETDQGFRSAQEGDAEQEKQHYLAALELLKEFTQQGHYTFKGLDKYPEFGSVGKWTSSPRENSRLHAYSQFWEIQRKELGNRPRS